MFTATQSDPSRAILICSPPYSNSSAGIVVLHQLCDAFVRLGYVAHIILMDVSKPKWSFQVSEDPSFYNAALKRAALPLEEGERWIKQVLEKGITIYPEIVAGNPLGAKHVVRYFLNSDGAITGRKSQYQPNDFCLAFSRIYFEKPHAVLIKPIRSSEFNEVNIRPQGERGLNLTFFGKGQKYASCFRIEGSIVLGRDWPQTKAELALLLNNTHYLFCWDSQTSVITDALYCGAKVVLLQFNQVDEKRLMQGDEFGPLPFFKGRLDGKAVEVIDNPEYLNIRTRFLERLDRCEADWERNVSLTLDKIFDFFIRSKSSTSKFSRNTVTM